MAKASAQGSQYSVEQVDAFKAAFLANLEKGQTHTKSAELAGVDYKTIWRWKRKDEEFDAAIRATEAIAIKVVEDALYVKATGGNTTAMIFWLCNRAGDRWRSVNRPTLFDGIPDGAKSVTVNYALHNGKGNGGNGDGGSTD